MFKKEQLVEVLLGDYCHEYVLGPEEYEDEIIVWSDEPEVNPIKARKYHNFLNELKEKLCCIDTNKLFKQIGCSRKRT